VAKETVEHSAYNNIAEPDGSTPIDQLSLGLFWETRQNQQTKPRSSKSIMAANKMCSL
jgi:hypothetical protein